MFKKSSKTLTKLFSTVALGVGIGIAGTLESQGQEAPPQPAAPAAVPDLEPAAPALRENAPAVDRRRSLTDSMNDYFDRVNRLHTSNKGLWYTPQTRTDVHFLQLPEDGFFRVAREYVDVRPMRWEWMGEAAGFQYNLQMNWAENLLQEANSPWTIRSGFSFAYYQNPDLCQSGDTRTSFYVEGSRDVHILGLPAYLTLGTGFSQASGTEVSRDGINPRGYAELDFPRLFGKPKAVGDEIMDEYALGRFSGMLRLETRGDKDLIAARAGIYYNHLKSENSVNFSAGPEVSYSQEKGVTIGAKVKIALKGW